MATITIKDIANSPLALVLVQLDANTFVEIYMPKQAADLITNLNSVNITIRVNPDRVILGA